jgi:hypothetical protein
MSYVLIYILLLTCIDGDIFLLLLHFWALFEKELDLATITGRCYLSV